jgi:predicted membrane channel-forming protein YqfA (hemolysin III family)
MKGVDLIKIYCKHTYKCYIVSSLYNYFKKDSHNSKTI